MQFLVWLISATAGAAVGGAAWVLLGHYANIETGWVAWGIGLLAGLAVRKVAGTLHCGAGPGMAALAGAFTSILLAKYFVILLAVNPLFAAWQVSVDAFTLENPGLAIGAIAHEIIEEDYEAAGKPVPWPEGVDSDSAFEQADYPPEIWKEAESRWEQLPREERQRQIDLVKQQRQKVIDGILEELFQQAFLQSFGLWDLLWFGLAMYTAYRVGSGVDSQPPHVTVDSEGNQFPLESGERALTAGGAIPDETAANAAATVSTRPPGFARTGRPGSFIAPAQKPSDTSDGR